MVFELVVYMESECVIGRDLEMKVQPDFTDCGDFVINSVACAFGCRGVKAPGEYRRLMKLIGKLVPARKIVGGTLPYEMVRDLKNLGFYVVVRRASDVPDKLNFLRTALQGKKYPVVIPVANIFNKNGELSGKRREHWLCVLGYGQEGFYVYNPYLEKESWQDVPRGNMRIGFEDMLYCWAGTRTMKFFRKNYLALLLGENGNKAFKV